MYIQVTSDKADEILELWNKEWDRSFPLRKKLFYQNTINDENLLKQGSYLSVDDSTGKVTGFILSKVWLREEGKSLFSTNIGWIQTILVDKDHRRKGVGSKLLQLAENALKEHGVNRILIGTDYQHYFPGVPEEDIVSKQWFIKKGYKPGSKEVDLFSHFDNPLEYEINKDSEVSYLPLEKGSIEEFLLFLHRCFPGRWEFEAIDYFSKGGTGREFVVAIKNNRIIGFCRINDENSPVIAQNVYWAPLINGPLGGIGPLGIDDNERGKGYGLSIVRSGVYYLTHRGIQDIVIDWTGLVEFYKKLGFEVWKSYRRFAKDI